MDADPDVDERLLECLDIGTAGTDGHPDERTAGGGRCGRGGGRPTRSEAELRRHLRVDGAGHGQPVPALVVRHGSLRRRAVHAVGTPGHEDARLHERLLQRLDGVTGGTHGECARGTRRRSWRGQSERRRGRLVDRSGGGETLAGLKCRDGRPCGRAQHAVRSAGHRDTGSQQRGLHRLDVGPLGTFAQSDHRLRDHRRGDHGWTGRGDGRDGAQRQRAHRGDTERVRRATTRGNSTEIHHGMICLLHV